MQNKWLVANFKAVNFYRKIAGILLVLAFSVYGQESADNFTVADSVYRAILDSLGVVASELFVENQTASDSMFLRSGWVQQQAVSAKENAAGCLVLDRFKVEIFYYEKAGNWLGWSPTVIRQMQLRLTGRLEDEGRVLKIFDVKRSLQDKIDWKEKQRLEAGPFTFCKGQIKSAAVWTRYLEPALIISAVAAAVYLFFSVRT